MVGYDLEKGGRPREAYDFWVKLWRDHPDKDATPLMLWDRVRQEIARLEKELSIPASERLFPEQPPSG
jgi:hypothetical protein